MAGELWFPPVEFWPNSFAQFRSLYDDKEFKLKQMNYRNYNGYFLSSIQLIYDTGFVSGEL